MLGAIASSILGLLVTNLFDSFNPEYFVYSDVYSERDDYNGQPSRRVEYLITNKGKHNINNIVMVLEFKSHNGKITFIDKESKIGASAIKLNAGYNSPKLIKLNNKVAIFSIPHLQAGNTKSFSISYHYNESDDENDFEDLYIIFYSDSYAYSESYSCLSYYANNRMYAKDDNSSTSDSCYYRGREGEVKIKSSQYNEKSVIQYLREQVDNYGI